MLSRRGFLAGVIAAGVAPAFVRRGSLGLLVPSKPAVYEWETWTAGNGGFIVPASYAEALRHQLAETWAKQYAALGASGPYLTL